jgi:hypothetical protein
LKSDAVIQLDNSLRALAHLFLLQTFIKISIQNY